jgi:demethoxyubiquinone hydroxylase (CLK1/Coq7/Cat5 family)
MWDQEKKHLFVMNKLQAQHRVRPTVWWEVAKVAGFGLGAMTALMGKEAAMACTEAVETVIGEHYDEWVSASALIVGAERPFITANSRSLNRYPHLIRACHY